MARETDSNRKLQSLLSGGADIDRNPWNRARHLPESNELEELRRCFNLVWKEFYNLEQTASTISQTLFSNARNTSTGGSADAAALIPAWTRLISPPFGIITLNQDGTVATDSRGYGIIQKVL